MTILIVTPRISEITHGHVGNSVLPIWFEEGRAPFFAPVAARTSPDAILGIVRRATYEYLREVLYGADVEVRTAVKGYGNTSVTFRQEAWQHGQLAVVAETVTVQVDAKERRKLPLSDESRQHLDELMAMQKP